MIRSAVRPMIRSAVRPAIGWAPGQAIDPLDAYGIDGNNPQFVYSPANNDYFVSSSRTTKSNASAFSRSGNATMVDSDGLRKWAPHNLALRSGDFSNAAWNEQPSGTGTVSRVGSEVSGGITAWRYQLDLNGGTTTSDIAQIRQNVSGTGVFTHEVMLKTHDGSTVTMQVLEPGGSGSTVTVTGDWQTFTVSTSDTGGSLAVGFRLRGGLTPTNSDSADIWVKAPRLYRSDLGGMVNNLARGDSYVPTTSSAKYLSRVGHHVWDADNVPWGPHNLLTYSEEFDNVDWIKTQVTVSPDSAVAPDGSTTADKIIVNSGQPNGRVNQGAGGSYTSTFSIFAKAAEWDFVGLYSESAGQGITFDLSTGTVGANILSAPTSQSITDVGDGWYLVTITVTATALDGWRIYPSVTSDYANGPGDGTSGIYIWGAHLYRSDFGGMVDNPETGDSYVATEGTAVDPFKYIFWRNHNLLTYSEELDNATEWPQENVSVTDQGDGSFKLVADATTNYHYIRQSTDENANQHTFEVEAKAGEVDLVVLSHVSFGGAQVRFDLTNGTVDAEVGTMTGEIEALEDGWYLCRAINPDTSSSSFGFNIAVAGLSGMSTAGDNSSGAFFRHPRLYRSDLAGMRDNAARGDSYLATTDEPVVPLYDGQYWINEGELIEPEARTNSALHSTEFANAEWVKSAVTISSDSGPSPAGASTADLITPSTASSSHFIRNSSGSSVATRVTHSWYVSASGYSQVAIRESAATGAAAVFELSTNSVDGSHNSGNLTVDSSGVEDVGGGVKRVWVTFLDAATTTQRTSLFVMDGGWTAGDPISYSYAGDGTSGVYAWGAQVEVGSTPSSPIVTEGSSVTRAADTLSIPASNLPYPTKIPYGDELWASPTVEADWTDLGGGVYEYDGTDDDQFLYQSTALTSADWVKVEFTVSGLTSGSLSAFALGAGGGSESVTSDGTYTFAIKVGGGSVGFDGGTANSGTQISAISVKEITAGDTGALGSNLVTNGTFDTDSAWTKGGTWSISGGSASAGGTGGSLTQSVSLSGDEVYQVTYDVVSITSGSIKVQFQGGVAQVGETRFSAGSYTEYFVADAGNNTIAFVSGGTTPDAEIDNITVRKVTPAALTIAIEGMMTYSDTNSAVEATTLLWGGGVEKVEHRLRTNTGTGQFQVFSVTSEGTDAVASGVNDYSPSVNVPFNVASRHTSDDLNAAFEGTATTETAALLPDISATDMGLASVGGGIIIKTLRVWGDFGADDTQLEDLTS